MTSKNPNVRGFSKPPGVNFIKVAMLRIRDELRAERMEAKVILPVHDELEFEAAVFEVETLRAMVKRLMEGRIGGMRSDLIGDA